MNQLGRQIVSNLMQLNGCAFGSLTAETNVPLKGGKKNPMQGKVTKLAEGANVMFFCNINSNSYQNMVKKRLASEGKNPQGFQLGHRAWGERVVDTPFIQHKGELYLEAIFLKSPTKVTYYLEGAPIAKNDIIGLDAKPEEGNQGGLENKVIIRSYKLSSIRAIKMGDLSVNV